MGEHGENLFDLTGRVAVVTGASGGLGLAMAKALRRAGAWVVLMGRREDALSRARAELGEGAQALVADVTDDAQVREAVEAARAWRGRIDVLVNAAGTHAIRPSHELDIQDWKQVIDVNLTGTFFCARAVAPVMRDQGGGKIINVGSVMSAHGLPRRAAYAASKGGVAMLTRSLAQEWGPWRINVNAIAPGFFRTRLNETLFQDPAWVERLTARIALGRPGAAGDLDGAVVFLASRASDYVTGHILYVDGGFTAGEPW
ncbi:MAG: glucose 1-dehydrogenase [Firmicutes bacterium]|nr:glucose 1-dehydrogenase [Bacillota bacterium]